MDPAIRPDQNGGTGVRNTQEIAVILKGPQLPESRELALQQLWIGIEIGDCQQPARPFRGGCRQRPTVADLVADRCRSSRLQGPPGLGMVFPDAGRPPRRVRR